MTVVHTPGFYLVERSLIDHEVFAVGDIVDVYGPFCSALDAAILRDEHGL